MVVAVVFHGFVLKLFLDGGRCRFSWLCVTGENRVVVWSVLVVAVVSLASCYSCSWMVAAVGFSGFMCRTSDLSGLC